MEEKNISHQESIEIITSMISRTKDRLHLGDGNIMLLWGYLSVTVAALVWGVMAITDSPAANWLWFLIAIVGGIATPLMIRSKTIGNGFKSYSDKISSRIWIVVGISGGIISLVCLLLALLARIDAWSVMFVFALVIVPFGEIMQGLVINEKSIVAGGSVGLTIGSVTLCCIVAGIPLYADWFLPLFMLAYIFMMIIPGHILNHKARLNP